MPLRFCMMLAGLTIALPVAGCRFIEPGAAGKSPLVQATPSRDSVSLEIFSVRVPPAEAAIHESLWQQIDEQQFPADLRRELGRNGFRIGQVGSHIPDQLARLLNLKDQARKPDEQSTVNLESEPAVTLRLLQTRAGRRGEVIASPNYEQLSLLSGQQGQVRGRTYSKAEGRLAVVANPESNGQARLELTPELHHGEQRLRRVISDGMVRLEPGTSKEVFDDLKITTSLVPGQMLVLSSLPDKPGSIGHYFFTEPDTKMQKVLVIRLAHARPDDLFDQQTQPDADKTAAESSAE